MLKEKESKYVKRKTKNVKIKGGVETIEGTPFNSVEIDEKFAITLGKNVLKTGFKTRKEAEEYVQGLPWEIILPATAIYNEFVTKNKK